MVSNENKQKQRNAWIWFAPSNKSPNTISCISPWVSLPNISIDIPAKTSTNSLSSITSQDFAEAIYRLLNDFSGIIIFFDKTLRDDIQLFDWESVDIEGLRLTSKVLFVRNTCISNFTSKAKHHSKKSHFFNLFPTEDWPKNHPIPKPFHSGKTALYALQNQDLSQYHRLSIFAHGDETGENLLRLPNGNSIHLKEVENWPQSLWLFACGEKRGKHLNFVQNLINKDQLKWALTTNGKINAEHALMLHNNLNQAIENKADILSTLLSTKQTYSELTNIVPVGNIPILQTENPLITFFSHQTLRLLLNKTSLSEILDQLYRLENIQEYDIKKESALVKKIQELYPQIPAVTKTSIVLPIAVFIAERSDHAQLDWFVNQIENMKGFPSTQTFLGLAKGLVRVGKYIAALKLIAQIPINKNQPQDFDIYLTLFSICNDLHLISFNNHLHQVINLFINSGELTTSQQNKWAGVKSIFSFEKGEVKIALNEVVLKHQKGYSSKQNLKNYESPDILYYATLLSFIGKPASISNEHLHFTLELLDTPTELLQSIGSKAGGSRTIKSLALWAWLSKNVNTLQKLKSLLEEVEKQYPLHSLDIGPLGFAKAFILLAEGADKNEWYEETYRTLLIDKHYLFETAMLDFLFSLDDQAEQLLIQFNQIREAAIVNLNAIPVFNDIGITITTNPLDWLQKHSNLKQKERLPYLIKSGFFPN